MHFSARKFFTGAPTSVNKFQKKVAKIIIRKLLNYSQHTTTHVHLFWSINQH